MDKKENKQQEPEVKPVKPNAGNQASNKKKEKTK